MRDEPLPPEALADTLHVLQRAADGAADDALSTFPDLGDAQTQRAVDHTMEAAADMLRALAQEARDIELRVRAVAARGHTVAARRTTSDGPVRAARGQARG